MDRPSGVGRFKLQLDEFLLLRDLIYATAGLRFERDSAFLMERRLAERIEALGLNSFGAYYKYLRFHPLGEAELAEAIERITTKETYFFRQEYQLRAFQDEILPRLAGSNREHRKLYVWSAGCATGEEAYTIAILIHQTRLFEGWDVRVVGSDLSARCVAHARRGIYREASFRSTPAEIRLRYFQPDGHGQRVIDELRKMCHFGQLNLLGPGRAPMAGGIDVAFCRNVLIYFDVQSRKRVIDTLYDHLAAGGYLLLGHSESLLNLTTAFGLVHLREDLVYRRPSSSDRVSGGLAR